MLTPKHRQVAAQKRRRQERTAFFQKQAEERKSASKPADSETAVEGTASQRREGRTPLFPEKRKREAPKELPLDLLESDDEDDGVDRQTPAKAKSKRRKVEGPGWIREPGTPRDQKVGSTVFRVVEASEDASLAPKAKKNTVHLKAALLRRNRVAQVKRGFFVKTR